MYRVCIAIQRLKMNMLMFVGIIPTVLNETIEGMACGVWGDDCDPNFSISVNITNCGSFFIYYLSPMSNCDTAYCAGLYTIKSY